MVHKEELTSQSLITGALGIRMLYGAGIAFLLIGIYLIGVQSNPDWSEYWMLRPIIIVPIAGAFGGAFFHFMAIPRSKGGWVKALAILFSFIGYAVIVWLGIVLGLDGTLWD